MRKLVIITGASGGIGRVVASEVAKAGYRVILIARSKTKLSELAAEINGNGGKAETIAADISIKDRVDKIFKKIINEYRGLYGLIHLAGMIVPIDTLEISDQDEWEAAFRINFMTLVWMMRWVIPVMKRHNTGSIVAFSGGGALYGRPNFSLYSSSKAAVVRLTDTIAQEVAPDGVRVHAVAPGGVNSLIYEQMLAAGKDKLGESEWQALQERKKSGGSDPKITAQLCLWLMSKKSAPLSGKIISAVYDNWKNWNKETLKQIMDSDWMSMRRIDPYTVNKLSKVEL